MNCGNSNESSSRQSVRSNWSCEYHCENSTRRVKNVGSNTNSIICALCGSSDLITVSSPDGYHSYGATNGWTPKIEKNVLFTGLSQPFGPLSPLPQSMFPQLSFLHLPSSLYYSHYNMRHPLNSSINRYFGGGVLDARVSSESPDKRKKNHVTRVKRKAPLRANAADVFRKDGHKNYPFIMSNLCPVFPYQFPSLAFPMNHPMFPVYLPMPAKWQTHKNQEANTTLANSPEGDGNSTKISGLKSERDLGEIAKKLVLEDKFDEDEDELNVNEVGSSIQLPQVSSCREINPEKFFNSKEECLELSKPTAENDVQNWKPKDCCIRNLSNENLWYEVEQDESNWDCVSKNGKGDETEERIEDLRNLDDESDDETVLWVQDQDRNDDELEVRTNSEEGKNDPTWSKDSSSSRATSSICDVLKSQKNNEVDAVEDNVISTKVRVRNEESAEISNMVRDQIEHNPTRSDLREHQGSEKMRIEESDSINWNDISRMIDEYSEKFNLSMKKKEDEPEESILASNIRNSSTVTSKTKECIHKLNPSNAEKSKTECKSSDSTPSTIKIKKDEKSKYYDFKIPVLIPKKSKKPDEIKKRWMT